MALVELNFNNNIPWITLRVHIYMGKDSLNADNFEKQFSTIN